MRGFCFWNFHILSWIPLSEFKPWIINSIQVLNSLCLVFNCLLLGLHLHTHTPPPTILNYATSMLVKLQWLPKVFPNTFPIWFKSHNTAPLQLLSFTSYLYHISKIPHPSNQSGNLFFFFSYQRQPVFCHYLPPSIFEIPSKFTVKIEQMNFMAPPSPTQLYV